MKENIFRKTEKKLYNYFDKDKLINSYKNKIKYLDDYELELEEKIVNIDIEINADIKAISYEERVQSSGDGIGYAERLMIEMIDGLIYEKCRVKKEILELETRIRRLESNNKIIESNLFMLKNDFQKFITNKYRDKKSNREIATIMNMSESTITRMKKQTLKVINSWEETLFYI
ncbi:hypothetical protein [uncultured Clostridium sp.]|jgi:DNA-directed RNA polymerase specialized sigma subunit|uniref:hypothetical protein n=1 Tax=uncultured Clostridium sp. TaxID=59620 RepID=UPI00261932B5|nr:hypothetical protein [uncultured Clostridium sp.]